MSDYISRQTAIDNFERYRELFSWDDGERERAILSRVIKELQSMPSVQPEPDWNEIMVICDNCGHAINVKRVNCKVSTQPERWIPCSDRLPDIGEHHVSEPCIVYCSNGAYGFAGLEENIFGQVGWNCERDDDYHEPLGEVLAWMPLPEPYREEGEE